MAMERMEELADLDGLSVGEQNFRLLFFQLHVRYAYLANNLNVTWRVEANERFYLEVRTWFVIRISSP